MSNILVGKVQNIKDKTIKVIVGRTFRHKKYHKELKSEKTYLVHSEDGDIKVGDLVEIIESKPISKKKRHIIKRVVKK